MTSSFRREFRNLHKRIFYQYDQYDNQYDKISNIAAFDIEKSELDCLIIQIVSLFSRLQKNQMKTKRFCEAIAACVSRETSTNLCTQAEQEKN